MSTKRTIVAAVGGLAVGLLVGTAGIAFAGGDQPATRSAAEWAGAAPSSAPTSAPGRPDRRFPKHGWPRLGHGRWGVFGRALHGEWVVQRNGKTVTLTSIRGTVTAVSATSITVKAADGFTATYTVNGDTRVRIAREGRKSISDVKTGDRAIVFGEKNGGSATAKAVLAGLPR